MKFFFSFFVRLFITLVAAKLLLSVLAAESTGHLAGLTLFFLAITYLFDLLEHRYQGAWRRSMDASETGWLVVKARRCWEKLKAGLSPKRPGRSDSPPEG